MTTPADNPIVERVDRLHDQWTLFAKKPKARLLRWVLETDEVAVLDALLAIESHPEAAETPDVFLEMDEPFVSPAQHGLALRESLRIAYERDRAALREAGVDPSWQCPPYRQGAGDIETFLAALESLRAAHGEGIDILATWLRPDRVSDLDAYTLWLQRLAHAAPSHLRFVVVDMLGAESLARLASAEPERVVTQVAHLDMPAAIEQLSAEAGNLDTPGGQYRHLYVQMGGVAKRGDFAAADALGVAAIAIAESQSWFHLAGVVHFFMGSLLLTLGRNVDAYHRFVATDASGTKSDEAGAPYGKKMRLQARFAAGSALIQEKAYPQAGRLYQETAPLAQAAEDQRAELDCWRLASYCYEQAGDTKRAWDAGMQGFKVALGLDEETRKTSTLPYLGEGLLRLSQDQSLRDYGPPLEERLVSMLGPNWRP